MLVDGKRGTDLELNQFVHGAEYATVARLSSSRIPPINDVDVTAEPAVAYVNCGRWIAQCPQTRCAGASYVWMLGPRQFLCIVCFNRGIRQRWRLVTVREDWRDVELVLISRHIWHERNAAADETVEALLLENADLGYAIPPELVARFDQALAARQAAEAQQVMTSLPSDAPFPFDPGPPSPDYPLPDYTAGEQLATDQEAERQSRARGE